MVLVRHSDLSIHSPRTAVRLRCRGTLLTARYALRRRNLRLRASVRIKDGGSVAVEQAASTSSRGGDEPPRPVRPEGVCER
eukprot:2967680-Prymnesium_polylepis.1